MLDDDDDGIGGWLRLGLVWLDDESLMMFG